MTNILDAINETATSPSPGLAATEGTASATAQASDTVLACDRWSMRRAREIAADWQAQEIAEHQIEVVADAHAALFDPEPAPVHKPADVSRAAWFKQMMETPEYRALHQETMLDGSLAAIASKAICDQWYNYAENQPEPQPGAPAPGSDEESIRDSLARMRSTAKALQAAQQDVSDAQDVAAGLGMGGNGSIDQHAVANYFKRVRSDSLLRDIFRMAGRMRALATSLQRRKVNHGRDDVVGIELSGDLGRLVPSELLQLACGIDELELLASYRLANRQAMSRQYRGMERAGKGPIVVVVDESGSMSGEKIIAAKALALTLAWLARQQKRWVALVGFAGGTEGTRVAFPPTKFDQEALIDWLTHFFSGGTNLDVPLEQVPEVYWPEFVQAGLARGKTDVILITDAIVEAPQAMIDNYMAWSKREQVSTFGIVVGEKSPGDLAQVCTRHWCIENLDLDSPALEAALSI